MTVAARAREAVDRRPFLRDALAAGVVNYTAAARLIDAGDTAAVAAALRRYAEDLDPHTPGGDARVTMTTGFGLAEAGPDAEPLLSVGGTALAPDAGSLTAVVARGAAPGALETVLGRCRTAGVEVVAAGAARETLVVAVPRRDGPETLRVVEDPL